MNTDERVDFRNFLMHMWLFKNGQGPLEHSQNIAQSFSIFHLSQDLFFMIGQTCIYLEDSITAITSYLLSYIESKRSQETTPKEKFEVVISMEKPYSINEKMDRLKVLMESIVKWESEEEPSEEYLRILLLLAKVYDQLNENDQLFEISSRAAELANCLDFPIIEQLAVVLKGVAECERQNEVGMQACINRIFELDSFVGESFVFPKGMKEYMLKTDLQGTDKITLPSANTPRHEMMIGDYFRMIISASNRQLKSNNDICEAEKLFEEAVHCFLKAFFEENQLQKKEQLQSARVCFERILALSKEDKLQYPGVEIKSKLYLIQTHQALGNYAVATAHAKEMVEIEMKKFRRGRALMYYNLLCGCLCFEVKFDECLETCRKAEQILRQTISSDTPDEHFITMIEEFIYFSTFQQRIHLSRNEYEKALEAAERFREMHHLRYGSIEPGTTSNIFHKLMQYCKETSTVVLYISDFYFDEAMFWLAIPEEESVICYPDLLFRNSTINFITNNFGKQFSLSQRQPLKSIRGCEFRSFLLNEVVESESPNMKHITNKAWELMSSKILKSNGKRFVVIPELRFNLVHFALLGNNVTDSDKISDYPLLNKFIISLSASFRSLKLSMSRYPYENTTDENNATIHTSDSALILANAENNLPESDKEAQGILEELKNLPNFTIHIMSDTQAKKANFIKAVLKSSIVHIATHGNLENPKDEILSGAIRLNDGILYSKEIEVMLKFLMNYFVVVQFNFILEQNKIYFRVK